MGKQDDLMVAVRKADSQSLVKLLGKCQSSKPKLMGSSKKLNINQLDSNGLSPLHQAAVGGSVEVTKLLLDHGASVDLADHKGIRPIHLAAEGGHLELVSYLLQRGASSSDASFDDVAPLHIACQRGHLRIVELLLQHQADPTVSNSLRKTPLDLASENGHEKVVDLLLNCPDSPCIRLLKAADVKAQSDLFLTSCLHLAAAKGHVNIVSRLLDAGCDVNRCTREGSSLHVSVAGGHFDIVTLLLARGVDVLLVNSYKQTALDVACRLPQSREHLQLRQVLQQCVEAASQRALEQSSSAQFIGTNIYDTRKILESESAIEEELSSALDAAAALDAAVELQTAFNAECSYMGNNAASPHTVPDVVHCTSLGSLRRSSDHQCHGYEERPPSPMSRFIVAPIRSNTDLSQNCGSVVLHASFDASDIQSSRNNPIRYMSSSQQQRSRSPVDQIVTLSSEDTIDGLVAARGTDSPGSSTSGVSSSSSGSSGYSGSIGHFGAVVTRLPPTVARQQHRLSGYSCESGVAMSSCASSSRHSYLSVGSSSSHSSLNRLPEDNESAYSSVVSFSEFYDRGYPESEIVRTWLAELHLEDCWPLFINAGYDMPTISRMTPEDLTAIGITQPLVRKKLTAEISRLHTLISDGIPNYRPNELKEWLHLLHLDEYCDTLSADECYSNMDKVVDITWEDLEDMGITKLGHQKKLMLAIDRLKKLKTSGHRYDQSILGSPSMMSSQVPDSPCPRVLHFVPDGRHYSSLSSASSSPGPNSLGGRDTSFTFETPLTTSPCVRMDIRAVPGVRTPEIIHAVANRRPPMVARPEVVAIQIKGSGGGNATPKPSSATSGNLNEAVYESFHGVVGQGPDFHSFVKPGMTTDTRQLSCERDTPCHPQQRTRWRSGGSAGSNRDSPVCHRDSPSTIGVVDNMRLECASSQGRSPQGMLRGGTSLRKIPPAPPRRTNSIKAVDGVIVGGRSEGPSHSSYATASLGRKVTYSGMSSELDLGLSNCDLSYESSDFDSSGGEFGYQTLRLSKTGSSAVNGSGSREFINDSFGHADCGTLPFANENIGTIRPRGTNHNAGTTSYFDYDTHTLRRRGPKKPLPGQANNSRINSTSSCSSMSSVDVRNANHADSVAMNGDTNSESAGVFDDIENMFHGLTHELNELLTQPEGC